MPEIATPTEPAPLEDGLREFVQERHGAAYADSAGGGIEQRVESLFDELKLPWTRGSEEGWDIASNEGVVTAMLDDNHQVLTFVQSLSPWDRRRAKRGSVLMEQLLKRNSSWGGACFAIAGDRDEGEDEVLCIIARIAAPSIYKEGIALALTSVFLLSRLCD